MNLLLYNTQAAPVFGGGNRGFCHRSDCWKLVIFSGAAGVAGSLGGADGSPAPVGGSYLSKPVIAARENLTKPNIKARK